MRRRLLSIYQRLYGHFGPQGWWPGRGRFEVIVGALLAQNTNWGNVEKAIRRLRRARALTPSAMSALSQRRLADLIRPAGYFAVKAQRLHNFLTFLRTRHKGSLQRMLRDEPARIREALLEVSGIGPETADSILLYAGNMPVFVVDAYTKRVLSRHRMISDQAPYREIQALFMNHLPQDAKLYNEYHALLVAVGKAYCRSNPQCDTCPLRSDLERHGIPFPMTDVRSPMTGSGFRVRGATSQVRCREGRGGGSFRGRRHLACVGRGPRGEASGWRHT